MPKAKYILVGSSHAALEALRAIRHFDPDGSAAMITRDSHPPYSPTILPYVVSGRSRPESVWLRDEQFFKDNSCSFIRNSTVTSLNARNHTIAIDGGDAWNYEKLLIATGAAPIIPSIMGLEPGRFHTLRTLNDAVDIKDCICAAKKAVVIGAGLVGLHAAENFLEAGLDVSIIDQKEHALYGYISQCAAGYIEDAFKFNGANLYFSRNVVEVSEKNDGSFWVVLNDGKAIHTDMILVAAGVRPATDWLAGSGVQLDRGVLVDETMRTSAPDVWAAGDVAQAMDFHTGKSALIGIIPTAVDQGRIAGQGMAGDAYQKAYPGGIPVNTYRFFGRVALSIGQAAAQDGVEVSEREEGGYRRVVLSDNRLVGYASVDEPFDVGIMGELIRRKVDLTSVKDSFIARPVETGRRLMSEQWR